MTTVPGCMGSVEFVSSFKPRREFYLVKPGGDVVTTTTTNQGAGVYPLGKGNVTGSAKKGWLALNLNAHDLPLDEEPEFYQKQMAGPLTNYWFIGNDDREKSYFLRMSLSCYRAVDYLTSRPDWDGKTMLVFGISQGGLQALMTAGLHPKVTAAIAGVPGGCDLTAAEIGRSPGWPAHYKIRDGKDPRRIYEASGYYDVVNYQPPVVSPGPCRFDFVCLRSPAHQRNRDAGRRAVAKSRGSRGTGTCGSRVHPFGG